MIWAHLFFPRRLSGTAAGPLELAAIPHDYWKYVSIFPRNPESLPSILLVHFTHLNNYHLSVNLSLLIVFMLILAKTSQRFWQIILSIMVVSGTLVWVFNPVVNEHTNLSGSSGLVFGLIGYIVLRIIFNIDFRNELGRHKPVNRPRLLVLNFWIGFVSLSVVILYWDNIYSGLRPELTGSIISAYGHMLGVLSGCLVYVAELVFIHFYRRD